MGEPESDAVLVARLRNGDEAAFADLVRLHHSQLIRLATTFVGRRDVAEDVAQETWLAMINGIDRFEGRSSLRTWLFQICANRARSVGQKEHRLVPVELIESAVDAEQFNPSGAWVSPPEPWSDTLSKALDDADLLDLVHRAMDDLPEGQRAVVTMRDIDGLSSREVCDVLSISEANQRVLLHRGREKIRASIERVVVTR